MRVHVVWRTATLYFLKFVWSDLQVEHVITTGFAQNFTKQTYIKLKQNWNQCLFWPLQELFPYICLSQNPLDLDAWFLQHRPGVGGGHSSSKAKMEVECRVMKQLPSYHIPHFSNIILRDAEGATPLSRMLIFKMSRKD